MVSFSQYSGIASLPVPAACYWGIWTWALIIPFPTGQLRLWMSLALESIRPGFNSSSEKAERQATSYGVWYPSSPMAVNKKEASNKTQDPALVASSSFSSVQGCCSYICKAPHLVYHRCFIQEGRIGDCDIQVRCTHAQLCLTLCDSVDCSLPGSTVQGILQASILKWVTIYYFRESSCLRDWTALNLSPALQADSLLLSHLGSPIVTLPSFNLKN